VAKIVYEKRVAGGYEYIKCPTCKTEIETRHPIELELPYCGDCGRMVLDAEQVYCCWCGQEFT
jgi:hypothetical protein